jgi:hypothetical protein
MADESDIPRNPKREWPDGIEHVCTGCVVMLKSQARYGGNIVVHESPREVRALMRAAKPNEMLELHHHADPAVPVYVRNKWIVACDARWDRIEEQYN